MDMMEVGKTRIGIQAAEKRPHYKVLIEEVCVLKPVTGLEDRTAAPHYMWRRRDEKPRSLDEVDP